MPDILYYPFMQRALLAGVALAFLLAFLGVFVVLKKMAFFASGIAHASLAGVSLGIIASMNPMISALIFGVIFSIIIYIIERKYRLPSDTTIGIIFTSGMALGVLLISLQKGYQPELISFLFGNILSIKNIEVWIILIMGIGISIFLLTNLRKLILISFDPETAYVSGIKVELLQLLMYMLLAVVVVLGIKVIGVVLVSALLIVPVATAKVFAKSFKKLMVLSVIISEVTVLGGIGLSYYLDFPTGPTIVLNGTLIFILFLFLRTVFTR